MRSTLAAVTLLGFLFVGNAAQASETAVMRAPTAAPTQAHDSALLNVAFTNLVENKERGLLLSESDVQRYRSIFDAQANADWAKADTTLATLEDRRLVGHVLAQRYLHRTAYRASYDELRAWLQHYGDLPIAAKIHSLALHRQPQGERAPNQPTLTRQGLQGGLPSAAAMASTDSPVWRTGLTAWQARDYAQALVSFQQLARSNEASPWDQSAGAFWTARCLARLHRPAEVTQWLIRAAAHPRTFYGLLANRQLGNDADLNWKLPDLTAAHLTAIGQIPEGKRALALLQVGQMPLAESELRLIKPRGHDTLEEALVALTAATNLPNLALRVGTTVPTPDGSLYDAALYPMPQWQPKNGFQVDRALIFALVRQESRFEPAARSAVGATGLMQLMPATASFVAGKQFDDSNLDDLNDPELNLTLGQSYVSHLLEQPEVNGNLFYLLAAYNGGPTQVARWKKDMGAVKDPLLFIELLPAGETRDFAQRVLANYWVYQLQMGRDTPSMDSVAAGNWPMYAPEAEQIMVQASAQPTLH